MAFVDESYSRNEALGVQRELEALPNVLTTTYVSKAQAMDNFAAKYADDPLFQNLDPEILRDRYVVKIQDLGQQSQTVAQLRQVEGIAAVTPTIRERTRSWSRPWTSQPSIPARLTARVRMPLKKEQIKLRNFMSGTS